MSLKLLKPLKIFLAFFFYSKYTISMPDDNFTDFTK